MINGPNAWKYEGEPNDMYVQEHTDLIASIRGAKPLNELKQVAESSLTAIMGRMSAYSGKTVTWDEAMNSPESLMPEKLTWGPMPVPPVPLPGQNDHVARAASSRSVAAAAADGSPLLRACLRVMTAQTRRCQSAPTRQRQWTSPETSFSPTRARRTSR